VTMKKFLKKHKWIAPVALAVLALPVVWWVRHSQIQQSIHVVKRMTFEKIIETKGEIHGKNAINITLPEIFKDPDLQVWEFKIKDLAPEGTIVKKGDWVATLDQLNLNQRIQFNKDEMELREAQLNDAMIDSAIDLSSIRQQINELEFNLQYRQLDLEQSKFESPAYQRKMQTAYNQTVRQIDRRKRDYELRKMHLENRTKRNENRYNYHKEIQKKLEQALEATNITAPEPGMLIYARISGKRKIRVGDEVGPWRPVIATLPDLSVLISETFVEEIDIAKIKTGDSARVTVDAIPGLQFPGKIITIANIGQELQGVDSKVFAITIELLEKDESLLPGMTSSNQIIIEKIPEQLIIPRKCLFSDSLRRYVYLKKDGRIWEKSVETGPENDDFIVILDGLEERDRILTHPPAENEKVAVYGE